MWRRTMKIKTLLTTLFVITSTAASYGMERTALVFLETAGQHVEEVRYILTSNERTIKMRANFNDENHLIVADNNFNTEKLEISFPENSATITIHRDGSRFVIEGVQNRSIQVDPDIPWYQSLLSLSAFVLSSDSKRSFYSLSSQFDERLAEGKGIQLLKLVAKREVKETVEIDGKEIEAWRVLVTFDDIRSLFWKACYWYRTSDGLLVMYKEIRGGPGTPETVGILTREGE
jgi:hypothetical protein